MLRDRLGMRWQQCEARRTETFFEVPWTALTSEPLISTVRSQQHEGGWIAASHHVAAAALQLRAPRLRVVQCAAAPCVRRALSFSIRLVHWLPFWSVHPPEPPDRLLISKHISCGGGTSLVSVSYDSGPPFCHKVEANSLAAPPTVRPEKAASDSASV